MSFAAVQKHVAVLERAGLVTKERIGRRKVVRTNPEALLVARRLLDQYEELWRARIDRMHELISEMSDAVDAAETERATDDRHRRPQRSRAAHADH
jgi:DNA-binding transcriptional ArsR family regulator